MRRSPLAAGRRGSRPAGPPRWVVALPAWGERCVRTLTEHVLPALGEALRPIGAPVTLLIWTDPPHNFELAGLPHVGVVVRPVPGPDRAFGSLSACHAQALRDAGPRDRVLLLTADMVVSCEVVATCDTYLSQGAQAVCCCAIRALEDPGPPRGPLSGPELLEWAWENRHPMTRECTWPAGRSYDVWRMYFERGGEVAARVFLPHPLAVVTGGRKMSFRPTIDVNLAHNFSPAVTRMITRPEEGAVVELSPVGKEFVLTETMATRMETRGPSAPPFVRCTNARHRMFFGKKVVVRGSGGDCGDDEVVRRMLG